MKTVTRSARKSVPLAEAEIALVQAIRAPGSPERVAVEEQVGALPAKTSQAQAIEALLSVGASQIRDAVIRAGYAAYAAAPSAEDAAYEGGIRARRNRLTG